MMLANENKNNNNHHGRHGHAPRSSPSSSLLRSLKHRFPLTKLRWLDWCYPCSTTTTPFLDHRARTAAAWLQRLDVDWHRPALRPTVRGALLRASICGTIRLVDRPDGPALRVTSSDPRRRAYNFVSLPEPERERRDELIMDVPLCHVGKVVMVHLNDNTDGDDNDNDNGIINEDRQVAIVKEIRLYGRGEKPSLLLQFSCRQLTTAGMIHHKIAAEDLATHIETVVEWDRVRRDRWEEQEKATTQRLREEKEGLMNGDNAVVALSNGRPVIAAVID